MTTAANIAPCLGCSRAQRDALERSIRVRCADCGQRWAPVERCEGCAETRATLLAMHNRARYQRCADCDRIVCVGLRALDRAFRGRLQGQATVRRREMLKALDNLARWWPVLRPPSKETSPIVGDGNKGGGARLESTEKPDDLLEGGAQLRRAADTLERLEAIGTVARRETRLLRLVWFLATVARIESHRAARAPMSSALERGHAVLVWYCEHCKESQRKKLAESVGWVFADEDTLAAWAKDPSTGRTEAKEHGTRLIGEAEAAWYGWTE